MDEVNQAMQQWSQGGFHLQHYKGLISKVMIHLYTNYGKGSAAYEVINNHWEAIKNSFLLVVQVIRIEAYWMRANSALAAATLGNSNTNALLVSVERDAAKVERELEYGNAVALLIRAGVAAIKKKTPAAIKLLAQAEEAFNKLDMALHVAIARRRRGELIGKNEGQELIQSADSWMKDQQIQNPERMAAIFAPGNWIA